MPLKLEKPVILPLDTRLMFYQTRAPLMLSGSLMCRLCSLILGNIRSSEFWEKEEFFFAAIVWWAL